jgi:ribosomal protein S18 acetylase RimI-like enzyme
MRLPEAKRRDMSLTGNSGCRPIVGKPAHAAAQRAAINSAIAHLLHPGLVEIGGGIFATERTPRIRIRRAQAHDLAVVTNAARQWWGLGSGFALPARMRSRLDRASFVAEAAQSLVGFLIGEVPTQPNVCDPLVRVVGVAPPHRSRGIGRSLYEDFFALARSAGHQAVQVLVPPSNDAAMAFHRALGFDYCHSFAERPMPQGERLAMRREIGYLEG